MPMVIVNAVGSNLLGETVAAAPEGANGKLIMEVAIHL